MKILKPEENIKSIISLINNAKKFIIIVSPFNNLTGWDELINAINEVSKKIEISYYVRKDEGNKGIERINVNIYEVPLLHAKMFFSESEAIISSGNLTNCPNINWVCVLDSRQEFEEIVAFFDRYIKPAAMQFNTL